MGNNYNAIAKIYDRLSRILYGDAIVKAQVFLIEFIPANSKVLIAGGGTGWVLEEISRLDKKNISVVYIEKSAAMIALSKARQYKNIHVEFIHAAAEDFMIDKKFDVIITPFFFDCFKEEKIKLVFAKLSAALKQNGLWLYADFVNDATNKKRWQQLLLKAMYLFFRFATNIETQSLSDMQPYFSAGYKLVDKAFFYKGFIQSKVYRKTAR